MDTKTQRKSHFSRTAAAFLPLATVVAAAHMNQRLGFVAWPADNSSFAVLVLIYATFVTLSLLQAPKAGLLPPLAAASLMLAGIGLAWEGHPSGSIALFAATAAVGCLTTKIVDHESLLVLESLAGAMALVAGGIALIIGFLADFEVAPVPYLLGSLAFIFGGYGLLHGQAYGHAVLAFGGMCILLLLSPGPNEPLCVLVALSVCYGVARWRYRVLHPHVAPPLSGLMTHASGLPLLSTPPPLSGLMTHDSGLIIPPPQEATDTEWTCPPPCPAARRGRTPRSIPAQAAQVRQDRRSTRPSTFRR